MLLITFKRYAPRFLSTLVVIAFAVALQPQPLAKAIKQASEGLPRSARSARPSSDKPPLNVLFILTDDLGYGDLGVYGHPRTRTPNIDQLAREGTRFTQFYVTSPVCSPSRASFMTGRHAQRFGIHFADLPEQLPRYFLPASALTINKLFRAAGYHTAHVGKWHLGEPPDTPMPRAHGFDHFFGAMGGRPSSSWIKFGRYDDAQFFEGDDPQAKTYPGYATDVTTDQALAYLDRAGKGGKPFYLNLWLNAPHEPLSPNVKQAARYRDLTDKKQQVYYGTVTNMDENVGRVLRKLDELSIADRTLVIFSSDNGPEDHSFAYSAGSSGGLRGEKTQLWEGGIRVPMIMRLPGVVAAGRTSDQVASALDLLPTLCGLIGIKIPNPDQLDEGINLAPFLSGTIKPRATKPRTLFWEYHFEQRAGGGQPSGSLVIRDGDWKLHIYQTVRKRARGFSGETIASTPAREASANDQALPKPKLYNLRTDANEGTDLAAQHPRVVARLGSKARRWFAGLPRDPGVYTRVETPKTEAEANRLPLR